MAINKTFLTIDLPDAEKFDGTATFMSLVFFCKTVSRMINLARL